MNLLLIYTFLVITLLSVYSPLIISVFVWFPPYFNIFYYEISVKEQSVIIITTYFLLIHINLSIDYVEKFPLAKILATKNSRIFSLLLQESPITKTNAP